MSWWADLWADVSSPAWTAGIVQTFLGAALAVTGAYLVYRRQTLNDQRLARQAREARRRMDAVSELGRVMMAVGGRPGDTRGLEYGYPITWTALVDEYSRPPGADAVSAAIEKARIVIDLDAELYGAVGYLVWIWRAAQYAATFYEVDADDVRNITALESAAGSLLIDPKKNLATWGNAFVRWDADEPLPMNPSSARSPVTALPLRGTPEMDALMAGPAEAELVARFERSRVWWGGDPLPEKVDETRQQAKSTSAKRRKSV